jgi:3-hydroxyacyl-[acyl-carrier-protein] dehydratase
MPPKPPYDISVIKDILPHRSPFLFVDRVIKFNVSEKIVAEKDLSGDEPFFAGHFPGNPIMPGVLVSEALAQTSGLLLGLTWQHSRDEFVHRKGPGFISLASFSLKFASPAKPGDRLRLESELKKEFGRLFFFQVVARVGRRQIAGGTLTLAKNSK